MKKIALLLIVTISLSSCQSRFDELQKQIDELQKESLQLINESDKNFSDLKMGLISESYYNNLMDKNISKQNKIHYEITLKLNEQKYELGQLTSEEYKKLNSLLWSKRKLQSEVNLIDAQINLQKVRGDNPKELLSKKDSINNLISEITTKINSY